MRIFFRLCLLNLPSLPGGWSEQASERLARFQSRPKHVLNELCSTTNCSFRLMKFSFDANNFFCVSCRDFYLVFSLLGDWIENDKPKKVLHNNDFCVVFERGKFVIKQAKERKTETFDCCQCRVWVTQDPPRAIVPWMTCSRVSTMKPMQVSKTL